MYLTANEKSWRKSCDGSIPSASANHIEHRLLVRINKMNKKQQRLFDLILSVETIKEIYRPISYLRHNEIIEVVNKAMKIDNDIKVDIRQSGEQVQLYITRLTP